MPAFRKPASQPRPIRRVLTAHPLLREALQRAENSALLAERLHKQIPLTRHCTAFGSADRQQVVLHLESAACAQRLRIEKDNIIKEIRKVPGFQGVTEITLRVSPATAREGDRKPRTERRGTTPPTHLAPMLRRIAADNCTPRLREVLLKLARHAETGER